MQLQRQMPDKKADQWLNEGTRIKDTFPIILDRNINAYLPYQSLYLIGPLNEILFR